MISENFEKYFVKFRESSPKIFRIKSFRKNLEIISVSFENEFGKFGKIFLEVSKNINEILKNYFENFQKKNSENFDNYFGEFCEILRKILIIKSENFDNHIKKFRKILRKISENIRKYFRKCREILSKFLRIILKIFKKKFGTFRELLRRISINIS